MRQRSLYRQLEAGLGRTLPEVYAEQDAHILWRGGRTPNLTFHGKVYRVSRLLKLQVRESQGDGELTYRLTPRRYYLLCDEPLCCNPNHMGTYRDTIAKRSDSSVMELVNELLPLEEARARFDSIGVLMEAVNPFYTVEEYEAALTSGLLPHLRQQLLKPTVDDQTSGGPQNADGHKGTTP